MSVVRGRSRRKLCERFKRESVKALADMCSEIEGQSEWISHSLLGMTGMTAYTAVFAACKLEKDQVVVVSGAAG